MQGNYYEQVMIQKRFLIHGNYYAGKCRNAAIARWNAPTETFWHWRTKFASTYQEEIGYWDPEGRWDEFIPVIDLGPELPNPIKLPE